MCRVHRSDKGCSYPHYCVWEGAFCDGALRLSGSMFPLLY